MEEKDVIEVAGKVVELLPGTMFRVELANGRRVPRMFPENARELHENRKNFTRRLNHD